MSPKKLLPYLIVLIVSVLIIAQNLNKPFIGHHDWNGVYYANVARNYLKFGLVTTKLGQVTNSGLTTPDQYQFYTHYPPLFPLILSVSFRLFGISEFSVRLVPVIFTISSMVLLFHLAKKLKLSNLAALTSTAVIFTPMIRYYGKMPTQEAPMIFFTLLSVILYLNLVKKPSKNNLRKFLTVTFLNGLTGWAGYFIYPLLVLHSYFFHKKVKRLVSLSLIVVTLTFALHLVHTYLLTGSFTGGNLVNALLFRLNLAGSSSAMAVPFTIKAYLVQQARWLTIYYTRPLLLLAFVSLLLRPPAIIIIFLAWGLSYPIIFSNVVFIHEYFNIFFVPFFALSFAWLIEKLWLWSRRFALITAFILITLLAIERLEFYQALMATKAHQPGVRLGNLINQNVPKGKVAVVVASPDFIDMQSVFVKYYADRQIQFIDSLQSDQPQDPQYFILKHD